jgi:TonB-dependent Receptor Plug Domain
MRRSFRRLGIATLLCVASPAGAQKPADNDAQGSDTQPTEVTVLGRRKDPGGLQVPPSSARAVPGAFGDPLRAIESMPSVIPAASGIPYFYVRGATPTHNGYFIDGVPVPLLFHIGPGPSVVPPLLLSRVDFFPGTAPARFGRFAGAIIAAETTPPAPAARGEAGARLFESNAFIEVPLGDGATSVLAAGRYGYPNLLLSVFAPDLSLAYWDYTVRVAHAMTPDDVVSVLSFGGSDDLDDVSNQVSPFATRFHRVDVRYDRRWSKGSFRLATTYGYDRTLQHFEHPASTEQLSEVSTRVRFDLRQTLSRGLTLSAGSDVDVRRDQLEFGPVGEPASSLNLPPLVTGGAYLEAAFRSGPVDIAPAARADLYRSGSRTTPAFDPRVSAGIKLDDDTRLVTQLGIAHQRPPRLVPVPELAGASSTSLQTVYQLSQGAELGLPWDIAMGLTAFYNVHRNMNDYVAECGTLMENCRLLRPVDGSTYGVELLLKRSLSKSLGGWISYTLSRAERRLDGNPYLSPFDRTHVLSLVASYNFGAGFRAGLRGTFYSGRPETAVISLYDERTRAVFGPDRSAQHRLPAFYRLDTRVEKRWMLDEDHWIAAVVEFFDTTLTKEAVSYRCDLQGLCIANRIGPVALPSVGVEAGF